jgi:hypothetical protein
MCCAVLCCDVQLKDEVVLLKAAVRTRDSKLTAAEESSTALKADLQESRQQVRKCCAAVKVFW